MDSDEDTRYIQAKLHYTHSVTNWNYSIYLLSNLRMCNVITECTFAGTDLPSKNFEVLMSNHPIKSFWINWLQSTDDVMHIALLFQSI